MTRSRRNLACARPESHGDNGEALAKYLDPHKIGAGLVGLPVVYLRTDAPQDWTHSDQLIFGAMALGVHEYPVRNLPIDAQLNGFPAIPCQIIPC
ncbi:hypothetical protein FB45DRAFT_1034336 [Roridomyces roridus]|uniref:Uncharacterized protein n=1 Tax=Roridomyces roridus TaxID=1738132 RepID=A0AAD7BCX1_9AGAR|nr:hypothetical protein FB45DRAFT_1034336 [Roridomyces roridus]